MDSIFVAVIVEIVSLFIIYVAIYKAVINVPKELEELLREMQMEKRRVIETTGSCEDTERLAVALFDVFLAWCVITKSAATDDDAKYCGDYAAELVNSILGYAEELKYSDTIDHAINISLRIQ